MPTATAMFSDEERGISDRGTAPPTFPDHPTIHAPTRTDAESVSVFSPQFLRENQELERAAKEKWKSDNPTWPFDAGLRQRSGFVFSVQEIKDGVLAWAEWFPGWGGAIAAIILMANKLRDAANNVGPQSNDDQMWQLVARVAGQVAVEAVARRIKADKARDLIAGLLRKLDLEDKIARKAAGKLIWVQRVARETHANLMKDPSFRKLRATQQGTKWDEAVRKELVRQAKLMGKTNNKNSFWFSFEAPLSLGSGRSHRGPNIDIVFLYRQTELFWIDLKLSTAAVKGDRNQTYMMVLESTQLSGLYFFMTPNTFVILPGLAGGIPLSFKVIDDVADAIPVPKALPAPTTTPTK